MQNLFDPGAREEILQRLATLQPTHQRQWGKMDVAQMLAHCCVAFEIPCGDRPSKQMLLGRILAPFVRGTVLGDKPMAKNAPTGPDFRIVEPRDFSRERERLVALVDRFCSLGTKGTDGVVHTFFGSLTGAQWGRLMQKHTDHHLRQFGV